MIEFPPTDPSLPIYSIFVSNSDAACVVQSPDYVLTKRQEKIVRRTGLSTGGLGPWTYEEALQAVEFHLHHTDFRLIRLDPPSPKKKG